MVDAASASPVLIENCHNTGSGAAGGPTVMDNATGELDCPYHIYRTGSDIIAGSWASFLTNLGEMVPFLHHVPPLSRPHCWAYPDAVQTGSFRTVAQDRANFGAWCVTSSPLILGTNLSDPATFDRIWPIVTNVEAIAVNRRFAGSPGRLARLETENATRHRLRAVPCDPASPSQQGWVLEPAGATLTGGGGDRGPGLWAIRSTEYPGLCVDAGEAASAQGGLQLRPCASSGPLRGCQHFAIEPRRPTNRSGVKTVIKAPGCRSDEGVFNGCFDISGKVGPVVQLTRCCEELDTLVLTPNPYLAYEPAGVDPGSASLTHSNIQACSVHRPSNFGAPFGSLDRASLRPPSAPSQTASPTTSSGSVVGSGRAGASHRRSPSAASRLRSKPPRWPPRSGASRSRAARWPCSCSTALISPQTLPSTSPRTSGLGRTRPLRCGTFGNKGPPRRLPRGQRCSGCPGCPAGTLDSSCSPQTVPRHQAGANQGPFCLVRGL